MGPVGIFLIIIILVNFNKIKSPLIYLHMAYIFISSILLTIINPKIGMYNFAFSLYSLVFWPVKLINKRTNLKMAFLILIVVSFLYYSLDWQMKPICNEIFFN